MKNVLVVYYSQSGQLTQVTQQLCAPLMASSDVEVTFFEIKPLQAFPFPWAKSDFFDVFPESFKQIPVEIENPPAEVLNKQFDLVILAYQVWYLTPSIPINSFLKSTFAASILNNTAVITVSGSRNMWVQAQEKVKQLLKENHANLVGNIALVDRHINLISVVTIVDWMFSGVKRRCFGILPLPGISQRDICESSKFGVIIAKYLQANSWTHLQRELVEHQAVDIRHFLVSMDKKANKMFGIWSGLVLRKQQSRRFWLKAFNCYLFFAIWILSPVVHLFHTLFYPILYKKIQREKKYYQGIQ